MDTTLPMLKPRALVEVAAPHGEAESIAHEGGAADRILQGTVRVSWFSHVGKSNRAGNRRFVLDVEWQTHDESRRDVANVEAWMECDGIRSIVLARRPMKAQIASIDGMAHIDIFGDNGDGRIAAISMHGLDVDGTRSRLLYAQTKLLAKSGFAAGSYDPPMMTSATK